MRRNEDPVVDRQENGGRGDLDAVAGEEEQEGVAEGPIRRLAERFETLEPAAR